MAITKIHTRALVASVTDDITANTAKTGITSEQASAITANTAKTGITSGQASAITANTAKVTNSTSASDLTSGTLPDARFPSALPAISGAALTNLPSSFSGLSDTTISTSDPAINSNPSATGHIWVNKTSGETYVCTSATTNLNVWKNIGEGTGGVDPYTQTSYLVIAGGGGGSDGGAGGGAGGYRNSYLSETSGGSSASESTAPLTAGQQYTITVGSAGARGVGGGNDAGDGVNSSLVGSGVSIVSTGGAGGNYVTNGGRGGNGGSGSGNTWYDAAITTAGLGIAGQGTNGGTAGPASTYYGGGGGGAGTAGTSGTTGPGHGGNGLASSITGSSVTRAGGGGGGSWYNNAMANGGSGGGGSGNGPTAGSVNTGSGGGGSGSSSGSQGTLRAASAGGSGVVILRMLTSKYTGTTSGSPTVSTSGSDTILIFNGSGTYTA